MFYIKICRKCKKIIITRNDNNYKDKKYCDNCEKNNLLCKCEL